jgi:hypothetical protein
MLSTQSHPIYYQPLNHINQLGGSLKEMENQRPTLFWQSAASLHLSLSLHNDQKLLKELNDILHLSNALLPNAVVLGYNDSLKVTKSNLPQLVLFHDSQRPEWCSPSMYFNSMKSPKFYDLEKAFESYLFCPDPTKRLEFEHSDKIHVCLSETNNNTDQVLVNSPSKYNDFDIPSGYNGSEFLGLLHSNTMGMSSTIKDLHNAAIAGGSLLLSLFTKCTSIHPESDVDIFVWGSTLEARLETINTIISRIEQVSPNGIVVLKNRSVLTILRRDCKVATQIIDSGNSNIQELLSKFDIDACKIALTNGRFLVSSEFINSINTQCTKAKALPNRVAKYLQRGFNIILDKTPEVMKYNYEELLSDPFVIKSSQKYLNITDEDDTRVEYLAQLLLHKDYELVKFPLSKSDLTCDSDFVRDYARLDSNSSGNFPRDYSKLNGKSSEPYTITKDASIFGSNAIKWTRNDNNKFPVSIDVPIDLSSGKQVYLKLDKLCGILGGKSVVGTSTFLKNFQSSQLTYLSLMGITDKLDLQSTKYKNKIVYFSNVFNNKLLENKQKGTQIELRNVVLKVYKYKNKICYKIVSCDN